MPILKFKKLKGKQCFPCFAPRAATDMFYFQSLKLSMYLRTSWMDQRLRYPYDYLNDTGFSTAPNDFIINNEIVQQIWVPDVSFQRSKEVNAFRLLQKCMGVRIFRNKKILISNL